MSTAPVVRTDIHVHETRSLLLERVGVLLRRACRSLGAGLARSRKQAGKAPAATGGLFASLVGGALTAKRAHSRILAVEERLTLGPKQHMYLVRCGEQRLLVASAGEGALQWMAMPGAIGPGEGELQRVATSGAIAADGSRAKVSMKRSSAASRAGTKSTRRNEASVSDVEGAR